MTGAEFFRRLKKRGRKIGVEVRYEPRPGKGSHGRIYYGNKWTMIPALQRELRTGTLHNICKELGISLRDLV